MADSFRLRGPACESCGNREGVEFVWNAHNVGRWLLNLPFALIVGMGVFPMKYRCKACGAFWTRFM